MSAIPERISLNTPPGERGEALPEDWPLVQLAELFDFRNGLNADKEAYGKGTPFVNVLEAITYSHLKASKIPGRVTVSEQVASAYSVRQGDVLFNRTSETQEEVGLATVYLDSEPVLFGGFVIRGRPKTNRLDPTYSGYALRARRVRVQIIARGQGAIRSNIGQADLKQVVVPVLSLDEQRAIAAVLSDTDALIAALDSLIIKKRNMKQGAMQCLLTGTIRLPGFSGKWDMRSLGGVAEIEMGQSPPGGSYNDEALGIPLINGPTEFTERYPIAVQWTTEPTKFCKTGDVLLCVRGSSTGRMNIANGEFCIGRGIAAIRSKACGEPAFMEYLMQDAARQILALTTGSTFPNIDRNTLSGIRVNVPPLPEQAAISSVLSDMHADIAALERQRGKMGAIKQGMMQSLLTGRVRLVKPTESARASA